MANIVTLQGMVMILWRQNSAFTQEIDYIQQA